MRLRRFALAILVFLVTCAAAMPHAQVGRLVGEDRGPGEWAEFASVEDRFTCNFPGRPAVSEIAWTSEFGAQLKGRVYSGQRGNGRYRLTAIDYSPVEALLAAKAQACPIGAETCRGGADTGRGIRYATVYYSDPDVPKPPLHQRSFISDFGRIDATGIR